VSAHNDSAASMQGLAARLQEPRLYVLTYKLRWRRWLPIPSRWTWEKVCTWDEALAMQAQLRAMGATNCEVRRG
jgi:hypothetical protein